MYRRPLIALALAAVATVLAACGSQSIELDGADRADSSITRGAQLFAERCAGCHTLKEAGAQGSATRLSNRERVDGPSFDQRKEEYDQILYAIRNGGFSGAIMPQNIVVGAEADDVSKFLAKYSGRQVERPNTPTPPQPGDGF